MDLTPSICWLLTSSASVRVGSRLLGFDYEEVLQTVFMAWIIVRSIMILLAISESPRIVRRHFNLCIVEQVNPALLERSDT